MQLLLENFNASAADGVMCRDTVNVGWDGRVFDCDFNQQLDLGLRSDLLYPHHPADSGEQAHAIHTSICSILKCLVSRRSSLLHWVKWRQA